LGDWEFLAVREAAKEVTSGGPLGQLQSV